VQGLKQATTRKALEIYANVIYTLKNKELTGIINPEKKLNFIYKILKRKTSVFTIYNKIPDFFRT
jgi:hypothetical protein